MSEPPPHDTLPQNPSLAEDSHAWYPDGADELPARPRIRVLTPMTVSLAIILFAACGFIAGVLVEKHQSSSNTLVGTAASRFGAGATGASGASGASGAAGGGRFGSLFGGGGSRGTIGTVTNIDGKKLYVTTTAGTMVEVVLPSSAKVTKSESVGSHAIHPGDSVVIAGITAGNGTVTASSVTDSGSSGGGSGLASLFGGAGSTSTSGTPSTGTGVASLFGG